MAVTEAKQQVTIIQQLTNMKKGGKSDTEIDRKEEAHAILSFAAKIDNKTFESLGKQEALDVLANVTSAYAFLRKDGFSKIINSVQNLENKRENKLDKLQQIINKLDECKSKKLDVIN